jgi:hypothetical protein
VRALIVLLAVAHLMQPRLQPPVAQTPPATLSYGALLGYGSQSVGWRFAPRPVPTTLFYPAVRATGQEATFAELLQLANEGPPIAGIEKTPVRSRKHATPADGRFPLVLFAHATPFGQLAMSEYLASHGMVVAGVMPRVGYRLGVDAIRTMIEDLETARRTISTHPFVDASRTAVVGASNGAFGAVGLGLRAPIAAIVSLDGTIAERAAARILPELAAIEPLPPQPQVLHLYTPDNAYLDLAQLKARGPACAAVRVPSVAHADFLSFGVLVPVGPPPFTRLRPAEKFASINRITLDFIRNAFHARPFAVRLTDGDRVLGLQQHACGTQN